MLNGSRIIKLSHLAIVSLLGLLLTGCIQSNGADYGDPGGGSESQAIARPAASPDSGMRNMEMPQKTSPSGTKEMAMNSVPNQVVIENFSFVPATLTIKAGTKVTWVNRDDVPHTATDSDKRFNSKTLDTDDQFSFTFSEPGTYNYYCGLHPKMTGQIIVK
jgi:plastocyanin